MKIIEFLMQNAGTIAVALIVILVLIVAVWAVKRDKQSGKSSCGGGCGGCPMSDKCHAQAKKRKTK